MISAEIVTKMQKAVTSWLGEAEQKRYKDIGARAAIGQIQAEAIFYKTGEERTPL